MKQEAFELLNAMERSWWYRGRAMIVANVLSQSGKEDVEVVLDFGSGFGGMHDTLARIGNQIYAFEPHPSTRAILQNRGYTQVFGHETDAFNKSYDLIGLFDVLEHIADDRSFLRRAYHSLRPGGELVLTVPAFPFLWSKHDVSHQHFRRYTNHSLRSALLEGGFEVEYISYWNMTLFFPAALMRLAGRTGETSLEMPRLLDAIFLGIVKVESLLMRILPLPFGTGLVAIARKPLA